MEARDLEFGRGPHPSEKTPFSGLRTYLWKVFQAARPFLEQLRAPDPVRGLVSAPSLFSPLPVEILNGHPRRELALSENHNFRKPLRPRQRESFRGACGRCRSHASRASQPPFSEGPGCPWCCRSRKWLPSGVRWGQPQTRRRRGPRQGSAQAQSERVLPRAGAVSASGSRHGRRGGNLPSVEDPQDHHAGERGEGWPGDRARAEAAGGMSTSPAPARAAGAQGSGQGAAGLPGGGAVGLSDRTPRARAGVGPAPGALAVSVHGCGESA